MSRPTHDTRHSAAPFGAAIEASQTRPDQGPCARLAIVPSRRAAALAGAWLILLTGVLLGAVALPLPLRIGLCIAITTPGAAAIRSCILLAGPRAVRTLDWSAGWSAGIGFRSTETPVTLWAGSFRVGRAFLLLWLQSCDGIHGVFIDAGRQDPGAFRRLCRQLQWPVSTS